MRHGARVVAMVTGLAVAGAAVPAEGAPPVDGFPSGTALGAAAAYGPVEEARAAARRTPFSARVSVAWTDRDGVLHTAELGVRSVAGHVRIQLPGRPPAADRSETAVAAGGLSVAPPDADGTDLFTPALSSRYEVVRGPGPVVAGRGTTLVALRAEGEVRERLAIDNDTGLVLLREVFGPEGRPVRVVKVLQLDTAPVPRPAPAVEGPRPERPRPLPISAVPTRYRAPRTLGGGYRRVAVYRRAQVVHLLYTDGLHGLSLFTQPGDLSSEDLPKGGEAVRVGEHPGVRYTWPGGEVITWDAGPTVNTLVGDGPVEDLLVVARSLPRPSRGSLLSRVRGTCRVVAELVSGGP